MRQGYSRGRRYPDAVLDRAMAIARETSQYNAARATGLSAVTIRTEMKRRGIPARRCGNYTREEAQRLAGRMVGL